MATTSGLARAFNDVPETELVPARHLTGGAVTARIVHGQEMSMMTAVRRPGYHSNPHRHDAEQMNYVVSGELWVFIGDEAALVREGDVFRVPRNALHWSWVQGAAPCTLLEIHMPPLLGDPGLMDGAQPLAAAGETLKPLQVPSEWPTDFDRTEAEKAVLGNDLFGDLTAG